MGRRGSRKSTSGCKTCKIRRIKCDETHPACHRCTSTGRKCDGYAAQSMRQVSIYNNRTQAQYQAFDFFIDQVLPGMTHVVDTEFWGRFLLQASHADSIVWLATTSMSELVRQLQPGNADRQLALQWYTRSIHELQTRIKRQMKWSVVCSITAILYICIECLLDNMDGVLSIYQQAMQHINGVRNDAVNTSIVPLLRHITVANGLQVSPRSISGECMSTTDAQETLYGLISESHQFVCHVESERQFRPKHWLPPTDLFNRRDYLLAKLQGWASATYRIHDKTHHTLSWSCMHLAHLNYVVWVSAILDTEMGFDEYHSIFEEMLQHAGNAINATSRPSFSFETRVIPSLGFVATRCRHPTIRRRAIQLLHCGPQIENTRSAASTIAFSKRIIAIEESGCATGAYCGVPASLELPPDINRLTDAKVEREFGSCGQVESILKFGRWRLRDNTWFVAIEKTKI